MQGVGERCVLESVEYGNTKSLVEHLATRDREAWWAAVYGVAQSGT